MNFKIEELTDEFKSIFIKTGGWNNKCPISLERLRKVQISHINFKNELKSGELLVLDVVAENVINIFKSLLFAEFPINSIKLLSAYNYCDNISMEDNNSSCFNNRAIAGTKVLSIHSYGLAIDINPLQNPMVSDFKIELWKTNCSIYPSKGKDYLNRANLRPGMVEPIVDIFFKNGFDIWGGSWNEIVDYHHFQVNRQLAEKLSSSEIGIVYCLWKEHIKKLQTKRLQCN